MARPRHRCVVDEPEDEVHPDVVDDAQAEQPGRERPGAARGQEEQAGQERDVARLAEDEDVQQPTSSRIARRSRAS